MKTTNEILTDIHTIIKDSAINDLSGGIYKGVRPTNSELQDCVITTISGVVGKFVQDGALSVKIFFPDISIDNTYYEDTITGSLIEKLLFDLSERSFSIKDPVIVSS